MPHFAFCALFALSRGHVGFVPSVAATKPSAIGASATCLTYFLSSQPSPVWGNYQEEPKEKWRRSTHNLPKAQALKRKRNLDRRPH
jgi:hypothetical protein